MRGEPCEYDTRLRNSFESRTKESNVKVILMIVGFIVVALKIIISVLIDTLKDSLILWLIFLAGFLMYIIYCIHCCYNSAVIESLRNQVSTLESKVEELNTIISDKNRELEAKNIEITENNVKIEELKDKLGNAYSMVEHVNSQDTAKLKAELSQDLHFSYDMWSEYKDAECSEDNFESLKIIIDELFRKIERKGINVKE